MGFHKVIRNPHRCAVSCPVTIPGFARCFVVARGRRDDDAAVLDENLVPFHQRRHERDRGAFRFDHPHAFMQLAYGGNAQPKQQCTGDDAGQDELGAEA